MAGTALLLFLLLGILGSELSLPGTLGKCLSGDSDNYVKLINTRIFITWSGAGTVLARFQNYSEVRPQCVVLPQATFPFSFVQLER